MARRDYSEEEIERGLLALALSGGHPTRAVQTLQEEGFDIPKSTLASWARTKPTRYAKAQAAASRDLQSRQAGELERLSAREIVIADRLLDRIERDVEEIPVRDLTRALQSLATAYGISVDKFRMLRDQPQAVVEHRPNATELFERLARLNPRLVIDSTAEEEPEPPELEAAA